MLRLYSYFWYLCFAFSLVWHIPRMYYVRGKEKKMPPADFDRYINGIAQKWSHRQIVRSRAKFNFTGMENIPKEGAMVFVANHQSVFDIAVFLAFIKVPHGYIAKTETLKLPMLRTWMKYMRCVFMDRSSLRKSAKALLEGIKILQGGQSMVLFPEGTRSTDGNLLEFKAASFKLATKAEVPIVPVTINGTRKIWEEVGRMIYPATVEIIIHPPVPTAGLSKEEAAELPEKVKGIIESGLIKQEETKIDSTAGN